MLSDDVQPNYEKIKKADAVVIGAPVYFGSIASTALVFIESFFGYCHVDIPIAGKPFVTVIAGSMELDPAVEQLHKMLGALQVNVVDAVTFESKVSPCLKCGHHKECEISGLYKMQGETAKELVISKEMFTRWEDDTVIAAAIDTAAEKLKSLM